MSPLLLDPREIPLGGGLHPSNIHTQGHKVSYSVPPWNDYVNF